ncbi:MAG: hypothetical protein IPM45_02220 [Acidimicrobiales bacterium]|nr:hypothetical protein [Acidimicrobiales bacterium]
MIRRAFWLGTGIGVGVGASYWVNRAVRRTAERYTPARIGGDVVETVRELGADLVDAVREGRQAMREREAELRAGLVPPGTEAAVPPRRSEPRVAP